MADRVTITRWRDAQADPPGHPGGVLTDQGLAWYGHTPDGGGPWYGELGAFGSPPLDPQPSWWCDPQPPGEDALTIDDLRLIDGVLVNLRANPRKEHLWPMYDALGVRLRAALDALDRKDAA